MKSKTRSSKFQYRGTSKKFMKKHIASRGRDFDTMFKIDVPNLKPREGENKIRLGPPTSEDMNYWALPIYVHYGIGPDDQQYLCPRKHNGGNCPVCEEFDRARKAGAEGDDLRPFKFNTRFLAYVVDRKDEEKGVQIWSMPQTLDGELSKQTVDPDTGETLNIDNPRGGYDVYFTREGTKKNTRYTGVKLARKPSDLDQEFLDFMIKNPLPDILEVYDYAHILMEFEGTVSRKDSDDDDDEDDDDKPARSSRPVRGKVRSDDAEIGEDDEDEDDEDEEDEDSQKLRRRRKLSKDEDEDEEDDEEEDDIVGDEITAVQLRKMTLKELKTLALEKDVQWSKLKTIAVARDWDENKIKMRLRAKIADALDIDLG